MRIASLTMRDFRGFVDATLDLDRPLTVLCGVNGSGKSTALQACLFALSCVLDGAGELAWIHFPEDTDIHSGAERLSVMATFVNGAVRRDVTVDHQRGDRHPPGLGLHRANLAAGGVPLIAVFYDASRAVLAAREAFAVPKESAEDPHSADDALVAGELKFRSLFKWFKAREDVENELKVSRADLSLEDSQLAAVRRAIAGMLPGFSGLRIQRDPLHMVIRKGSLPLVLDQLSDGERLLLALTADLARRLAIATEDGSDALLGEGVVLIDEIELHLHPGWQRSVLADLRRTFPNCQFIVTTHSAQVLSEVPTDAVTLVEDFQFFRPAAPTEGRDANAILEEVLGVAKRPEKFAARLADVSNLLDDDKVSEARDQLDEVANIVTERDPEVTRLRGLIDIVERLDAADPKGA